MNKWTKIFGGVAAITAAGVITVGTIAYAQDIPDTLRRGGDRDGRSSFLQRGVEQFGRGFFGDEGGRGRRGGRHGGPLQGVIDREVMQGVVAQTLGMTVEELEVAKEEGKRLSDLAEEKGVEMETIQEALKASAITQVQQAVTDGDLTQEEADRILERIENGRGFGPRGLGRGAHRGGPLRDLIDRDVIQETVAQTLGITVEELEAAKDEGKKLSELAEEKGVEMETVKEAMKASAISQVQQAVTDGELTQEEADRLIERIESGRGFGRRGQGPGRGGHRGLAHGVIDRTDIQAAVAQALGITVEELKAAKDEGKTIEDLATERGLEQEQVKEAVKATLIAQVQQAVADGELTQEEADRIIERIENGRGHKAQEPEQDENETQDETDAPQTNGVEENGTIAATQTDSNGMLIALDAGSIYLPVISVGP
ncbi:hypothetical protein KFU94_34580 [Chloroflexi bacterium TSY]|nr:hypothetical protein [Chloroflexi bacterium TSY]